MKATKAVIALLAMVVATASAQGTWSVRPDVFSRGYNTYAPNGQQVYSTRPDAFSRGWNVYDNRGMQIEQWRPDPFNRGWNVQTMPRRSSWYGW